MFITFEGGEGTGKSTQVMLLAERLRAQGKSVVTTREPGGTIEAEALRSLLVSGDTARWTADEELLLNFAARSSHLRNVIVPALRDNKIVICDRFIDSSFVYQCVAGDAHQSLFRELITTIADDKTPNFTFILDLDPKTALGRTEFRNGNQTADGNADRYERKGLAFHQNVRQGFLELSSNQPHRCHLIDANGSPEIVAARIWTKFNG